MEKRQKEKMKRMEEERVGTGQSNVEERKVGGSAAIGPGQKVHPGYFPPHDSAGKPGETCHNVPSKP